MATKTLNGRVISKHDIEENWWLAENFTPQAGEIIVYDPDEFYNYSRLKIGDGIQNVNDLPFLIQELSDEEIGEIFGESINPNPNPT